MLINQGEFKNDHKKIEKFENPESLKKQSQQFQSFLTNVPIVGEDLLRAFLQIVLFTVFLLQAVSEKALCTKDFTSNLIFLHENNCNYNSCRFSNNFAFILVFPLLQTKTRTRFSAGGLVSRNISDF